jgi:hypothetical protein
MSEIRLSYSNSITIVVDECQIKVGSHYMSDQLQGEHRKLIARYKALVTSSWRLTQ